LHSPENVDSLCGIVYRRKPAVKTEIPNSGVAPDVLGSNRWFSLHWAAENSSAYNVLPIKGLGVVWMNAPIFLEFFEKISVFLLPERFLACILY